MTGFVVTGVVVTGVVVTGADETGIGGTGSDRAVLAGGVDVWLCEDPPDEALPPLEPDPLDPDPD